jgi:hypothetical protein
MSMNRRRGGIFRAGGGFLPIWQRGVVGARDGAASGGVIGPDGLLWGVGGRVGGWRRSCHWRLCRAAQARGRRGLRATNETAITWRFGRRVVGAGRHQGADTP